MMDRQDRGHDGVAVFGDSAATHAWDFGDEAMGARNSLSNCVSF